MSILRASLSVGGYTMISRILGFVRDMLIARTLGAGERADIWVAVFRFPNLFRRIIAEGAFSAAFIPIYGKTYSQYGQKEADSFSGNILTRMGLWVLLGVILFQILMPYLVFIFAPGFSEPFISWCSNSVNALLSGGMIPPFPDLLRNDKINLTILLTTLLMPYAGFMFICALMSSLLHYHKQFVAPAFAPILLNIFMIVMLLLSLWQQYDPLYMLSFGVFMAGIAQIIYIYLSMRHHKISLHFGRFKAHSSWHEFKKLFWPGIFSGGITHINLLIGSIIASFQPGALASLYYADRIYQLPLGIIGVTLGVIILPNLVTDLSKKDFNQARNTMHIATQWALFLTLPAMVAMLIMPKEIIILLFEYGAFTRQDTQIVMPALMLYAVGLPAFVMIKIYNSGYYALENTRKPMIFSFYSVCINIFISCALFQWIGFYSIVLGTIIGSWQNMLCLLWGLQKNNLILKSTFFNNQIIYIIVCLICMISVIISMQLFFNSYKTLYIISMIIMALCTYLIIAYQCKLDLIKTLIKK